MKVWMVVAALAGSVSLLSGCGGGLGSCSQTSQGAVVSCLDYEEYPLGKDTLKQTCTSPNTYSDGACTSANRVGRCRQTISAGGFTVKQVISFYAPTLASTAQSSCTSAGTSGVTTEFIP
jgi:hypothetical protein